MKIRLFSLNGYTLVEVIVVIIIMGIIASVAVKSLTKATETARFEETKQEMELLAYAIAGNPNLISNGIRTDYGYIGDIGSLPVNWDALVTNPGGYATWEGPYIQDEFSSGAPNNEFKLDGWGNPYSSPANISFSSTGGSTTLTRQLTGSIDNLLYNQVRLAITDLDYTPPGINNADSVQIVLTYPNGAGSITSKSAIPEVNGFIQLDSIPIGIHTLRVIFIAENDTLTRLVNINPGQAYYADIQYFNNIW